MMGSSRSSKQDHPIRELQCSICLGALREPKVTECLHRFCKKCIHQHLRQYGKRMHLCPLCNKEIRTIRSLKSDKRIGSLIQKLYPHQHQSDGDDGESIFRKHASSHVGSDIWITAAATHKRRVASMKEQQRDIFLINHRKQVPNSGVVVQASKCSTERHLPKRKKQKQFKLHKIKHKRNNYSRSALRSVTEAASRSEVEISMHTSMIDTINKEVDDNLFNLEDMLGVKEFQFCEKLKERIEMVEGPFETMEAMIDTTGCRAKERIVKMLAGSVTMSRRSLENFLLCIPPIQVKFCRHMNAPINLPHVHEDIISFPADTTIIRVKEALSLLLKDAAAKWSAKSSSIVAPHPARDDDASSNANCATEMTEGVYIPEATNLILRVPVPHLFAPDSALYLNGYRMHLVNNDDLNIYQVRAWYDDCCSATLHSSQQEQLFGLLFSYDIGNVKIRALKYPSFKDDDFYS